MFYFVFVFLSPHQRTFFSLLFREREEGKERSIDWLPPIHTRTGDRTCNLSVYGTTLQPTEPPLQVFCKCPCGGTHKQADPLGGLERVRLARGEVVGQGRGRLAHSVHTSALFEEFHNGATGSLGPCGRGTGAGGLDVPQTKCWPLASPALPCVREIPPSPCTLTGCLSKAAAPGAPARGPAGLCWGRGGGLNTLPQPPLSRWSPLISG